MRVLRRLILGWLFVVVAATGAWALTATPTATEVLVSYTEPTTNADGSALDDLAETRIYYQLGTAAPVLALTVPASAPTGGADISRAVIIPVGPGQQAVVAIWATAVDLAGNESERSNVVQVRIDRLAPAPPR